MLYKNLTLFFIIIWKNKQSMLVFIVTYIFSIGCFTLYYHVFQIDTDDGKYVVCESMLSCFGGMLDYGLRGQGFWEDLMDVINNNKNRILNKNY